MSATLSIAGEVAGAAAGLAGLILVFFGAALSGFDRYTETQKGAVRGVYRRRAWPAFAGFVFALASCALALYAKTTSSPCPATWAVALLAVAGIGVFVSAFAALLEIG